MPADIPTHSEKFNVDSAAFKLALQNYDSLMASSIGLPGGLDAAIQNLDSAIAAYANANPDTAYIPAVPASGNIPEVPARPATYNTRDARANLKGQLDPISNYSAKLTAITNTIQSYVDDSSQLVLDSQGSLLNQERYINRLYPEDSVNSREVLFGFFPQIRTTSIPYILAASIFMISLTVFLIFQMAGVTGQLNLPPSLMQWYSSHSTPAVGSIPFYKNPMVLGGVILLLLIIAVIFIILYAKSKNTNKD